MDFERLRSAARGAGAASRLDALRRAAYSGAAYAEAGVDPAAASRLEREAPRLSVRLETLHEAPDGAVKAALRLADGLEIESVLLRPSPARWTACVSSQAGCALGCTFCATGLMGLARDLSAEEIWDQALFWRGWLRERGAGPGPQNLVFMGMGEPLANYAAVSRALRELTDPKRFGMAPSRIAVSTAGVAPAIERFARELPEFPLAVSLHAADDALRSRLVPVNRSYPLASLRRALSLWLAASKRKLLVEYVLLRGENDSLEHARRLAEWLETLGPKARLHVNLIDFNPTAAAAHAPSDEAAARAFHASLKARGFAATRRVNRGRDAAAACGQLLRPR